MPKGGSRDPPSLHLLLSANLPRLLRVATKMHQSFFGRTNGYKLFEMTKPSPWLYDNFFFFFIHFPHMHTHFHALTNQCLPPLSPVDPFFFLFPLKRSFEAFNSSSLIPSLSLSAAPLSSSQTNKPHQISRVGAFYSALLE